MRVALVVFKGLGWYGLQLANGLRRLTELHVFAADAVVSRYGELLDPAVRLYPMRTCRYRNPAGLLVSLRAIRHIRNLDCDVVHLVHSEPWFNVCIPFLRSFPLITTVHDVRYHLGDRRSSVVPQWVADVATRHSFTLVVHGEAQRAEVCRRFGIAPESVFSIPAINCSLYRKWAEPGVAEEPNNILFFGSIWEYKGLRYLMEAEELLGRELGEFRITIAGTGEDFSRYEPYIRDPKHYEILNEFIPDEKVAGLFQKASVVVIPYTDASQTGIAPLAFSFGKPVVATRVGSIPEIVSEGEDGLLVEPRRPDELARALLAILQNPERKRRMSGNARRKADTRLSESRIAQRYLEVYSESLRRFRLQHRTRPGRRDAG